MQELINIDWSPGVGGWDQQNEQQNGNERVQYED